MDGKQKLLRIQLEYIPASEKVGSPMLENRFREHRMDSFSTVNQLGYMKVSRKRAQKIGFVARHSFFSN